MSGNYRTVRVSEALVESVLNVIEECKELGYRSHSEFIIEAIRRRVEELIELNLEKESKEKNKNE